MTSSWEKVFQTALKKRVFDPVYYFYGEDEFLKGGASRDLVDAAVDPSTRDFNLEMRRAADLDAEGLDALLGTPPMLAERRVVVVRDVDKLKKSARAVLDRYLTRPASDTVLVLVSPAGIKVDKGLSERATAMEFRPLSGERLPKWVAHHAMSVLQRTITPEAATLLIQAVGDDLSQLAVELEKLASFCAEQIDERAVSDVVGVRRGETLGDFLDAVAMKEVSVALGLIPIVMQLPKTSGVSVVMALTAQTLALAYGEAALASGVAQRNLFAELMALLKETGAYPGRPWGEAVTSWAKHSARGNAADLDTALGALLVADAALKDTRLSSPEQHLTTLVLTLCSGASRHAA